jgi:carboxypeptidase C (cathepsin A)
MRRECRKPAPAKNGKRQIGRTAHNYQDKSKGKCHYMQMPLKLTPLLAAVLLLAAAPATAQHAPAISPTQPRPTLPAPSVTHHTIDLPGRTLHFTATAGAITVTADDGTPEADIATIAYTLDGAPVLRPVVFAFNGGPGFASAFVQLGGFGPWRIPMDDVPSTPPSARPNAETWLGFADLVFIDPVETGYSRFDTKDESVRKRLLSVSGDINAIAQVIRDWLQTNHRLLSPKFIAGESYGGFRAPRITRVLQSELGIGIDGLILISPALDTGGSAVFNPLRWVALLPTYAAVNRGAQGNVSEASLANVEAYAIGEYFQDQLKVAHDPAALDRITSKVSALTGLDPALVRRMRGRIDIATFLREHQPGQFGSFYDATLSDPRAVDANPWFPEPEPITSRLTAPFTEAMLQIYDQLRWHPDGHYQLQNGAVERQWDWQKNRQAPEAITALRIDLAVDPHLRVLIAHGLYDTATPYFQTKMILGSIPDIGPPNRITLLCLPAGHMVYARDAPRRALRDAVQHLILGE